MCKENYLMSSGNKTENIGRLDFITRLTLTKISS